MEQYVDDNNHGTQFTLLTFWCQFSLPHGHPFFSPKSRENPPKVTEKVPQFGFKKRKIILRTNLFCSCFGANSPLLTAGLKSPQRHQKRNFTNFPRREKRGKCKEKVILKGF